MEVYTEFRRKREAHIKVFAEAHGWRQSRTFHVGKLIPGHKDDWQLRVPYDDHAVTFCENRKPIAYVSQPYGHAVKDEMITWAARYGLKVEFPDELSFHNEHCLLCIFTRDMESSVWQAVQRLGESWVANHFNFGQHLIDPDRHGDYVELYQHAAEREGFKTLQTRHLFDPDRPWTRVFIWPIYRGFPVSKLSDKMIKAVIETNRS